MDDEILSITGRSVPRIGDAASEQHWLWSAARAALCPLVFLPRYIYRGDWFAVALWTIVLVAGVARSHQRVKQRVTPPRLIFLAAFIAPGMLVFVAKDSAWRIAGLVVAACALLLDVAVSNRTARIA